VTLPEDTFPELDLLPPKSPNFPGVRSRFGFQAQVSPLLIPNAIEKFNACFEVRAASAEKPETARCSAASIARRPGAIGQKPRDSVVCANAGQHGLPPGVWAIIASALPRDAGISRTVGCDLGTAIRPNSVGIRWTQFVHPEVPPERPPSSRCIESAPRRGS
jgi:hypothetical protein